MNEQPEECGVCKRPICQVAVCRVADRIAGGSKYLDNPFCHGHQEKPQAQAETWDDEFDEKFVGVDDDGLFKTRHDFELKSFIRTLLSAKDAEHAEVMKRVRGAIVKDWEWNNREVYCLKQVLTAFDSAVAGK